MAKILQVLHKESNQVISNFSEWVVSLDPSRRRATLSPASVLIVVLLGLAGMVIVSFVPGPRDFFGLRFIPTLICFLPSQILAAMMARYESKRQISLQTFGLLSLTGAGLFQMYMWSLVAFCNMPGALLASAFPILLVAFHGHLYQASFHYPYPILISTLAAIFGISLNPEAHHLYIYSVAVPMALGSSLLLGMFSRHDYRIRREREQLRAAIDAQMLEERTRDISRINGALMELRGRNHDAGNALSGLMLNVPHFVKLTMTPGLSGEKLKEAGNIACQISGSLSRLYDLLHEARSIGQSAYPEPVDISPVEVMVEVISDMGNRFPRTRIQSKIPETLREIRVLFYGGKVSLHRIFTNVILNACQGDGNCLSSSVEILFSEKIETEEICIRIVDDGPGFLPEQLLAAPAVFHSTKPEGTGLGLYTTYRILSANNGRFRRENRTDVPGAIVELFLRKGHL